ncbi:MAG: chloride channel protein [Parvibaculum sp.]|uniref:chloride channel protein n=1 Tax=Parvibaculum sp. TaxID=2024848 RepID=UPI0025D4DB54|nr:chloride channel protein [Parvibaculum sp.]MCE9650737.1 chloride channel protein [Parvibaculum sp.]
MEFKKRAQNLWRIVNVRALLLHRSLRSSEWSIIILCAPLGIVTGISVFLLREAVYGLHDIAFGLKPGSYLSAQTYIETSRLVLVPVCVSLAFGVLAWMIRKRRSADITDPVEANALFGGRMSMLDSIRLTIATMLSNSAGASVGMEAGYTQFGAAIFSSVAQYFRLRRDDARIYVTAGAAAAIAAAFNAPLAGAFYGFELVLGSYAPRALAPVAIAALAGTLTVQILGTDAPLFAVATDFHITPFLYMLFAIVGIAAAGFSILTMRAVTLAERALRGLPIWARPAIGGAALSLLALGSPQVLGSGHGAIQYALENDRSFTLVALLLAGKLLASAISLGSGLRGGMFSSALFLGVLLGGLVVSAMGIIAPDLEAHRVPFMLVGMGAVGAAIIGAPITMVLLVLEGTGNFPITMGVLVAVVIASTIMRLTFGYSFSTWRFHLRGIPITGAHDVGWIADLTVLRAMRSDPVLVPANTPLLKLRQIAPLGGAKRVFIIDDAQRYRGLVQMETVHDPDIDDAAATLVAGDLARGAGIYLQPRENLRVALSRFETVEMETLPVVNDTTELRVIGYITEAYALRRYTQELERQRGSEIGQSGPFPLGPTKA